MRAPGAPSSGGPALLVGAGRSSLSVARFLAAQGVPLRVCDLRSPEELSEVLAQLPPRTELVLGGYDQSVLEGCAAVYASPGVAWDSPLLEAARARGITVSRNPSWVA